MAQKRIGCYACFQTLDPKDKISQMQAVVKCTSCGAHYHAACAEGLVACYRCAERKFQATSIARPARLPHTTKQRAQTIKPSTVLFVDQAPRKGSGQSGKSEKTTIGVWATIVYTLQTLWSAILAFLLIGAAAAIGIYGYPLIELPTLSTKAVMDAIFRAPPPHPLIIAGAIGSGLIGGFVFYNRPRQVGRRFTYLLAGIVGLAAFNSWLLDMAPADFLRFAQTIVNQRRMLFYTQEITLIAIVLLTPVHRALAPLHLLPERSWPAWINNLYGWLRLLLASAFVTMTTIYFTTRWLALEPQPKVATFYPINLPGNLTEMSIFTAVALAGALTIAAILYWPPPFRRVQWRFGFIRLLLLITGIVLIGFLYRTPINAQAILVTLQYTGALMLLGLPIQRSLS